MMKEVYVKIDLSGVLEADIILDEKGVWVESLSRVEILKPISAVALRALIDANNNSSSEGKVKK